MKSILQKARGFFSSREEAGSRLRRSSLERRRIKRLACHQSFLCSNGRETWPVTVVDLGFGGFKIRSEQPVGKKGDILHLRRQAGDEPGNKLAGSYTTGIMVRVAWTREDQDGWESGLYLPESPGSMRIRWFKELLHELRMDETEIFSKRSTRRHRCRLPAELTAGFLLPTPGMVFDLSPGGALFASGQPALLGTSGGLGVTWGPRVFSCEVSVVGVRPAEAQELEYRFLHSLRFEDGMEKDQEALLVRWLEELSHNE